MSPIPDAELLVSSWLRSDAEIVALEANVAGGTPPPDKMTHPWIRVTRLTAPRIRGLRIDYAIRFTLQLDCYAGKIAMDAQVGQAEANALGGAAREMLTGLAGTVRDGVVISSVDIPGDGRFPDTTLKPARERVILVAEILMHPA